MTQNKTYRMAQVSRLLQEEIASILLTELQDERLKTITVTEVRTSKDLRHATVFITIIDNKQREEILEAVNEYSGLIRKLVGNRVKLKRTPAVEFKYDESLDHAVRILSVLEEVKEDVGEEEGQE